MPIRVATEYVAAAVRSFLVRWSGPEARWVAGVNLLVDGGHHLRRAAPIPPVRAPQARQGLVSVTPPPAR